MVTAESWSRRVLIAASIGATLFVVLLGLRALSSLLLLFFAGVVLAAFLRAIAGWIAGYTRVSVRWALALAIVGLAGLSVAMGYLLVPRLSDQLAQAPSQFVEAKQRAAQYVSQSPWLEPVTSRLQNESFLPSGQQMLQRVLGIFSSLLGILGSTLFVLFVGVYLAVSPGEYLSTSLLLVPPRHRRRVERAALDAGEALQRWILGRILSMAIVGVGTAMGLWLVGSRLALSLGLLAAVLSFVPYVGPVLASLPAMLLAIPQGLLQLAWVALVYVAVQLLESYVITPQIQRRAVRIAPALLLLAQSALGMLTGVLGLLIATPLVACLAVLVRVLYVEDVLGDRQAAQAGE